MTKKGNLCASNLPCPTWISPVEKLRCRILLGILGACESTAEWGDYMSQMRKDVFTDRWVPVAERDAVQPLDFQFKKFRKDSGFCPFCENNEAATPPSTATHIPL